MSDALAEIASITDVVAHESLDSYQLGLAFGRIRAIVRQEHCRIAELEGQVLARDAQVLEDGRTIVDQRVKLDGARQIIEGLRGHAMPLLYARRVDHWLASATPSAEERLRHHLTDQLARAAIAWSNGEVPLLELQEAAHVLRAASEP